MKKLALMLVIGAVTFLSACGPSAKEKAEKRLADSIRVADSITFVQVYQQRTADSIAKVQALRKTVADSIAHQDSIKKHLIKPAKAVKPVPAKKAHKK